MKIMRFVAIVLVIFAASFALASDFPDIDKGPECELCQMNRDKFSHSRAMIEWEDGSVSYFCSINCVAAKLDPAPAMKVKKIMVADKQTKELVEVEKAFWVIGGDEKGVMTVEPKWAFGAKERADSFIEKHGGQMASWDETWNRAKKDIKKKMKKPSDSSMHEKSEKMEGMQKKHE